MSIADKLSTIAENEQKVFDAGKQEEYDRFWDRFQLNGARANYYYAFAGYGWDNTNFYPKYNIAATGDATRLFFNWDDHQTTLFDLKARLEECGVVLDVSGASSIQAMFSWVKFTAIPPLDFRGCSENSAYYCGSVFACSRSIETIESITVSEYNYYFNWFDDCNSLKNITFIGTIGQNIDFKSCSLLTTKSLLSILTALSKNSTYASGKTLTLNTASKAVIEADASCSEQLSLAVSAGWTIAYNS